MASPTVVRTVKRYPLDGSNRDFNIEFDYLARKFVVVSLVDTTGSTERRQLVNVTDYRFTTKTSIQTTLAHGGDGFNEIEIRRVTSTTERVVDFADGSVLRAADLNAAQVQAMHIAEEGRDQALLSISVTDSGQLDAHGMQIINVAPGTDKTHAVNKDQLDTTLGEVGGVLGEVEEIKQWIKDYIDNFVNDTANLKNVLWVYNGGLANGGETEFKLEREGSIVSVPALYINGNRQERGWQFDYSSNDKMVRLAQPLKAGDFVALLTAEGSTPLLDLLASSEGAGWVGTKNDGKNVQQVIDDLYGRIDAVPTKVPYLDPFTFGAKGGDADDRVAIQAAIDQAAENYISGNGPTTVVISAKHNVSLNPLSGGIPGEISAGRAVFNMRSGVTVTGNGSINLIKNFTGTTSGAVFTNWTGPANNIRIHNITIDCGYVKGDAMRGISAVNIVDSWYPDLFKVKAYRVSNNGLTLRKAYGVDGSDYGCAHGRIESCVVDSTYYIGIQCERPMGVLITANTVLNTGDNAIDVEGNQAGVTSGGFGANVLITNNELYNSKNGIFVESMGNTKVDHNYIYGAGIGIIFNRINSGSFYNSCIGNSIEGTTADAGYGIRFINQIGRITVSDNFILRRKYGIAFADRIDRMTIGVNTFAGIGDTILYFDKVPSGNSLIRSTIARQNYQGGQTSGIPYPTSPRGCPFNYPNRMASTVDYVDVHFLDYNSPGEVNYKRSESDISPIVAWGNKYARYGALTPGYTSIGGNHGFVGEYLEINNKLYQIYNVTASMTEVTKWDGASFTSGNFTTDFPTGGHVVTRRVQWGTL
ncbi:tail protein [Enterobacter phage phiEap-1]|uniref:Probable tail spike protein n=1 Tax=Enterobacter phage phiEap-1 TaxID=1587520 RepID=A0A0K2FGC3_9CAUD|nr:tail protein [Enterobacter phage phiEap-1]ALA45100.1 hypothetical protein RU59_00037 [Enterobacter phage phiEap-1]